MNCRICKSYLGFNDDIMCEDIECVFIKDTIEEIGIHKLYQILKRTKLNQKL